MHKIHGIHVIDTACIGRWAVGVLIFEMVAGYPPFYTEDRVTMFKNICHVKYTAPPHFSKVTWKLCLLANALLPGTSPLVFTLFPSFSCF